MAVTKELKTDTSTLVSSLKSDFPELKFARSDRIYWSPKDKTIYYSSGSKNTNFSILHELGHMLAGHNNYKSDVELLIMESEAWHKALEVADKYNVKIDKEYIEDCMDSYRNWLHNRSTCPNCSMNGTQDDKRTYSCINCYQRWNVSKSRFCRSYRMKE